MRRFFGPLVLLAAAAAALLWLRPAPPDPAPVVPAVTAAPTFTALPTLTAAPTVSSDQPPPATSPPGTASASLPTGPPSMATPRPQRLHGRVLAVTWLNGYLNRSDQDEDGWSQAISSLTTPELLEQLKVLGPDNVGLPQLKSWRVTKVTGYDPPDKPVDTPSRQVLTYIATVTDGRTSVDKPFELYSYLAEDGRWVIASIDQPFTTEE